MMMHNADTLAYDLDHFCQDARAALASSEPLPIQLGIIEKKLHLLLLNKEFVAATFNEETPAGKDVLYHDPEFDFYVQAHMQKAGKGGLPHSHGESWAIYGNAMGFTQMTEWKRVNPETEDHAVLTATERYDLHVGDTRIYGPGVIHSTGHPEKAWVVRIAGTDLDNIPRFKFRKSRDQMV
jgi:hypothetical protein